MRRMLAGHVLLLSWVLVACTSGSSTAPPDPDPAASASEASATPPARTKAEDAADLKKALVSAQDLGSPWTRPKSVSRVKGKRGEVCPGHVSAVDEVPMIAEASVNLTEGRGDGKNIASFSVRTLADDAAGEGALVAAYDQDQKACGSFKDGSDLFVVRTQEGPESVDGTAVLAGWAERIYFDKSHKKLAYARHYLIALDERVLTYVSYAFLTEKKDPKAKNFSRTSRLLEVQLGKNAKVFA